VVDREKPTLIVDNVDTLFQRKPEVTELYLNAWTRDIPVLRVVWVGGERQTHRYDVFCPKACSLVGTNLPEALLGRCLLIELWRLKPGETVKKVDPLDAELMEEFKTLQRKLARWSNDHAAALKSAKPTVPTAFVNRPADNWTLLWAIADLAGGDWAEQARDAAERLSQDELVEPSWLEHLLLELWVVFVEPRDKEKRRDKIASAALVKRLTADLTSVWCDYGRGHRVTQREVAALLRKLHIHPRGIAIGKKRVKGYFAEDFFEKQVFERILSRDPLLRSREPAR
jgi:putative DNA primase/helicase